jgi:acetyl esterase/lipase
MRSIPLRMTNLVLGVVLTAAAAGAQTAPDIRIEEDLAYRSGPDLDDYETERCRLDLFLPGEGEGFPTMLWFHGGSLTRFDKSDPMTRNIAATFARAGIAVAVVNYRLSPRAKYPAYIDDAAAATAWVLASIARHGGDPDRVFLAGHSAGGYLVLMLGMDPTYLQGYGVSLDRIRGIIPIGAQTFTHYTIREERGIPDPEGTPVVDEAAPCHHAHAGAPPILALCADGDSADRRMENRYLLALLDTKGHGSHRYLEIPDRNHWTMIWSIPTEEDPVFAAISEFVGR